MLVQFGVYCVTICVVRTLMMSKTPAMKHKFSSFGRGLGWVGGGGGAGGRVQVQGDPERVPGGIFTPEPNPAFHYSISYRAFLPKKSNLLSQCVFQELFHQKIKFAAPVCFSRAFSSKKSSLLPQAVFFRKFCFFI